MAEFFHMGGYAMYVWPSFLISLLVLVANVWYSKFQYKRVLQQTSRRVASQSRKDQTQQPSS